MALDVLDRSDRDSLLVVCFSAEEDMIEYELYHELFN